MLNTNKLKYFCDVVVNLAWNDIRVRYKRSVLGPFWSTINLIIFIAFLSLIFSTILSKNLEEFVPFVAFGFLFWNFISGCVTESADVMIQHKEIINNVKLPYLIHPAIVIWRNLILLCHNFLIVPFLFYFFDIEITFNLFYFFISLLILIFNTFWISALVSVICLRYLDLKQIVLNLLNISFYLTPIIWSTDIIKERFNLTFLYINPFFSFIESVRDPILNQNFSNFIFMQISLFFVFIGVLIMYLLRKYDSKISLWV